MKISELASRNNLQLAWKRISTGGNLPYKRLYRQLYYSYEIALDKNLRNLGERLRGGSYNAFTPERIFIPKPSGLHRPITLLHIEDQVVLQAFANLAAKRMQKCRSALQLNSIYTFFKRMIAYSSFVNGRVRMLHSSGRFKRIINRVCIG